MEAPAPVARRGAATVLDRVAAPLLDALAALSPCLACGARPARAHGLCLACSACGVRARRDGDVVSLGRYRDGLGELVRAAKFAGAMRVLDVLGAALAEGVFAAVYDACGPTTLHLVPVPSHPRRRAARGDDPSLRLARAIARLVPREHGVVATLAPALRRTSMASPQSTLSASRRAANVADAFTLDPRWRARLSGADVVLVDDVLTSGSTARAAAAPLRAAGACIVAVAVVAVARS